MKTNSFLIVKNMKVFIQSIDGIIINYPRKELIIKNRLLRPKDKERYNEFTVDLYEHGAIDRETFVDIKNNRYKDKRKDNFER